MLKLVIKRKKWVNGSNNSDALLNKELKETDWAGASELLNDKGNMCCLGFLGKACGIPKSSLLNECVPFEAIRSLDNLGNMNKKTQDKLLKKIDETPFRKLLNKKLTHTKVCNSLIKVNDSTKITNAKREEKIAHHMKKIGVQVKFVD